MFSPTKQRGPAFAIVGFVIIIVIVAFVTASTIAPVTAIAFAAAIALAAAIVLGIVLMTGLRFRSNRYTAAESFELGKFEAPLTVFLRARALAGQPRMEVPIILYLWDNPMVMG